MKVVYDLLSHLNNNPDYVKLVQALTLNINKPNSGLKGTHGLFGSLLWWDNIRKGIIKSSYKEGIIVRLYSAGQDNDSHPNSFEIMLDNGEIWDESIYVNNDMDIDLFKVGRKVFISYIHDERKLQPSEDGGINYSNTVLEMSVSEE